MAGIEYELADGTVLVDGREEAASLPDQIAFERQFKRKFAVVVFQEQRYARYLLAEAEAAQAGGDPPEPDEDAFSSSEWTAFFSWRRLLRAHPGKVAASYDEFLASVVSSRYLDDDAPADTADQTAVGASDSDDGHLDANDAELLESGSGLDPTGPARRPTPRRTSSSPVSTGRA